MCTYSIKCILNAITYINKYDKPIYIVIIYNC